MVNECDPSIAAWTEDGGKFVVKNKDVFAATVIPQYYDHSNYSSFTRQLNFYGFTREQSMTIKVHDLSSLAVGQETFHHDFFQRGRPDLLKNLQRKSTDNKNIKKRKKPRTGDSAGFLEGRIESLEDTTKELLSTVTILREENCASMNAIIDLQNRNAAKDGRIDDLEKRIEWLERRLAHSASQREDAFLTAGQRFFGGSAQSTASDELVKNAWANPAENASNTFVAAHAQQPQDAYLHTDTYATSHDAGATLARHPKMKKSTAAPNKDFSSYDASSVANSLNSATAMPMRESSLDFGVFTGLTRESTLLSWLPRMEFNDKTLS
jgi:HSF-type DNA-binding